MREDAGLIDREATLKKMCEARGYCERFEKAMRSTHPDFVTDKCNNYKFLAEQPTIEPEVRHGRWIPLQGWFNKSSVKCSVCENTLNMDGVNAGKGDANFCPNCGTKMDLRTPTEVQLDEADDVMMGG